MRMTAKALARREGAAVDAGGASMSGQDNAPGISVILATRDAASQIRQTVDSVLSQTLQDFELIVVDDGSTDATVSLLRGYEDRRLHLFTTPSGLGAAAARDQAMTLARGRYIAALEQDDICHPGRLAAQSAYLDAHADTVLVGTATRMRRDDKEFPDRYPARTTPDLIWWLLHVLNPLIWSSVMLRATSLQGLDLMARDEYPFAEDFDLYHRLGMQGRIARLDTPMVSRRWREHPDGRLRDLRMSTSATKILAQAYRKWFGPASEAYAELMTVHVAAGRPVSEPATLNRIAAIFQSVERSFCATYTPDTDSRALIAAEMSRLWWGVARAAIRSGTVTQALVMEHRPDFATADGLTAKDLFRSSLIGSVRARRG